MEDQGYGVGFGLLIGTAFGVLISLLLNIPMIYTMVAGPGLWLILGIIIENIINSQKS
ncbi:hypothetical protein [Erysipelothrix rhusiopathiae]|uniref:hypothetical protein n=1 Tax=Erysipelothrix rhusiopathiae TaxID=1648 RepID=UPI0013E2F53D|nr:hypothetical protein [Erysipelothrix rhusiopathiae]